MIVPNETVPCDGHHDWNCLDDGLSADGVAFDAETAHERWPEILAEGRMEVDPGMVLQSSHEMIAEGTRSVSTGDSPQRLACKFSQRSLAHRW